MIFENKTIDFLRFKLLLIKIILLKEKIKKLNLLLLKKIFKIKKSVFKTKYLFIN